MNVCLSGKSCIWVISTKDHLGTILSQNQTQKASRFYESTPHSDESVLWGKTTGMQASRMWPSERKWLRLALKTGQGWIIMSYHNLCSSYPKQMGTPEEARLRQRRKCPASGCPKVWWQNAPRIILVVRSLIASSVWETTQKELAVVVPEETSRNHSSPLRKL